MIKTLKNADSDLEVLANLALVMWNKHSVHDLIDEFSKKMAEGKTQFFCAKIKSAISSTPTF